MAKKSTAKTGRKTVAKTLKKAPQKVAKKEIAKPEKATRDKKRDVAFDLFCQNKLSQKEICAMVGWSEKTFTETKKKLNWDSYRGAQLLNKQAIINKLLKKLDELSGQDTLDADEISKIASAIERMESDKTSIPNTINALTNFTNWLFPIDSELAKQVNLHQQDFISEMISK